MLFHPAGEEPLTDFIIKQLPYDLSNQAGLALIGKHLKRINFKTAAPKLLGAQILSTLQDSGTA